MYIHLKFWFVLGIGQIAYANEKLQAAQEYFNSKTNNNNGIILATIFLGLGALLLLWMKFKKK